jgi:GrpB-like predicted nucleotidyltransferase (UPF0157 family)
MFDKISSEKDRKPHRPYRLVEYDPNWPNEYIKRREKISSVLGENIIDIQHVGSTSIVGMTAKPQIDILVAVKDLGAVREKYGQMLAAGFRSHGDYDQIGEEYFTEDNQGGERLASVHIVLANNPEMQSSTNFRDYLSVNGQDRNLYINVKREAFEKFPDDYSSYGQSKKDTIKAIMARASKWAAEKKEQNF